MKKYITLLFLIVSCSSLDPKAGITLKDYNEKISKDEYINILKSNKFEKSDEFYDYFKEQLNIKTTEKLEYISTLVEIMLEDIEHNKELKNKMYEIYDYDDKSYAILSLLENKNKDYTNSYNDAWISKTYRRNYLADEIFFYLSINEGKDILEEVLEDIKNNYSEYPLIKYDELIYKGLYKLEMQEKDFDEARMDIRKINDNFYPELRLYRTRLLLCVNYMQADYYARVKSLEGLEKLYNQLNYEGSNLVNNVDIQKLNKYISQNIEVLKGKK